MVLVTGANGQLGNEMPIVRKCSQDKYIFTDVVEVEGQETTLLVITNMDAIRKMVNENDVKVIENSTACTNVDKAESDQMNIEAPGNLAIAIESGGLLVLITDYVFRGDSYNTPCKENQKRNTFC